MDKVMINEFTSNQRKWIDALKSGKYKQTISKLKKCTKTGEFSYCCLGVAIEISDLESKDILLKMDDIIQKSHYGLPVTGNGFKEYYDLYDDHGSAVQVAASEWCAVSLYQLNDDSRYSFKQIANVLETKPWLYFKNFNENYKP